MIRQRREHLGLSQEELAAIAGVSRASVQNAENPDYPVTRKMLIKLGKAMGITIEQIDGADQSGLGRVLEIRRIERIHGVPAASSDRREPVVHDLINSSNKLSDFAVVIDGECMEPEYPHGSTAYFHRLPGEGELTEGKDYILWIDGEATFKQVFFTEDRHTLILRPRNPDRKRFRERRVDREKIEGAAIVVSREMPPP